MSDSAATILALDIGAKRIGLARANSIALIAESLDALPNDNDFNRALNAVIAEQNVKTVVIGLPRNLKGLDTQQTEYVRNYARQLKQQIDADIEFFDEALSSVRAEENLEKLKVPYNKADIDSESARIILDDYISHKYPAETL